MEERSIKLTQYSTGGGCGCKIAPQQLDRILKSVRKGVQDPLLIVGNDQRDDAAVYDLGDMLLISTIDFFTPIVNDPYEFGRIAAANAISDVYAMGGRPLMATAVLGWPLNKLDPELATEVLNGGIDVCQQAGIALAGGHSVDIPEPLFGLSVNGTVKKEHLKTNAGAKPGDLLYLTKRIGTGMLSTALKKGIYTEEDLRPAIQQMGTLNSLGMLLGALPHVHAVTDVTGFGILGHLVEMAEASTVSMQIDLDAIPLLDGERMETLIQERILPGNTKRNFESHREKCVELDNRARAILCDPQTNGPLLIAVDPHAQADFEDFCRTHDQGVYLIGEIVPKRDLCIARI